MTNEDTAIIDESALLAGYRKGSDEAGAHLMERYWSPIYRFCLSYLSDDALAEDVAQETFTKLASTAEPPSGDLKPWLYKVARNRCLDILRRHERSPTFHRPFRTGFDAAGKTAGPSTRVANHERQELLREIISAMPEEYRSVLMLKHIEGLSRLQIAETLGVSEPTVKGRLVRASEYLREELRKVSGIQP